MQAGREQALAYRVAAHHLAERLPPGSAARAAFCGLQDFPPGTATLALAARVEGARPEDMDELAIVYSRRGAATAVAPEDIAVFTAGLEPPDEAAARALIGNATETLDPAGIGAMEALDRVGATVADAFADGPLARDDFHQALRERLPGELLWWCRCRNCGSHHVHPSLWRATGVKGVLAVAGREGRTTIFGAPPPAPPVADPAAELVRRFLRAYAPAGRSELAAWAGIAPGHAAALLSLIEDETTEVEFAGRMKLVLTADAGLLADPPAATGVRLLPPADPYLDQRDRDTLLPDPELRARVRRPLGNPGVVLAEGELAGLWRPAKKGQRLVLTLEAITPAARAAADAIRAEAGRVAAHRGCTCSAVGWAA
jgi:Winged helix DNA-binding domain